MLGSMCFVKSHWPQCFRNQKMIEAREQSGKKLMCAQHFRFRDDSKMIQAQAQAIAPVYHARSWMLRRNALPVRDGFLMKQHSGGGRVLTLEFIAGFDTLVHGQSRAKISHRNLKDRTGERARSLQQMGGLQSISHGCGRTGSCLHSF